MRKNILSIIIGLVAGSLVAGLVLIFHGPSMMMLEDQSRFNFEKTVADLEELAQVRGWSVPAVHDLQKSVKKAGHEVNEVKVFALCKPDHAVHILRGDEERVVANMMPCRVAVYVKEDGNTYISRMNSKLMSKGMGRNVRSTMKDAFIEMEEILAKLVIEH
jgi:uncharacterized protein (DUF302 family)